MKRFRNMLADCFAHVTLFAVLFGVMGAQAQTVYVTRGERGEWSFSDQPGPGARQLELVAAPLAAPPSDATSIETMLAVADSLAKARQQREDARREQRAALTQLAPAPPVVPVVQTGPAWWWRRPGFGYRAGAPWRHGYQSGPGFGVIDGFERQRDPYPRFRGPGRQAEPRRRSRPFHPDYPPHPARSRSRCSVS